MLAGSVSSRRTLSSTKFPAHTSGSAVTEPAAEQRLRAVINWGRRAEILAYEDHTGRLRIENPT